MDDSISFSSTFGITYKSEITNEIESGMQDKKIRNYKNIHSKKRGVFEIQDYSKPQLFEEVNVQKLRIKEARNYNNQNSHKFISILKQFDLILITNKNFDLEMMMEERVEKNESCDI
jgi:hypothetical protein